jgi:uracil-DNA glycosylase family 4
LVSQNSRIYDQLADLLVDEAVVQAEFELPPNRIPDYKALVGDVSDNIKGVPGVGEKTALSLLKTYGSIAELLDPKNAKELLKKKSTEKVLTYSDILELTYQLVKLPTLRDARTFLSEEEFATLRSELTKPVIADPMSANVETDVLGVRTAKRYVSSLADELVGILPHFVPEPVLRASELSQVDQEISTCLRCGYYDRCPVCFPVGQIGCQFMLVLSHTHRDHIEADMIGQFLSEVGLTYEDCWTTFAVKAAKSSTTMYNPPSFGEVKACSRFLRAEIDLVKPKMIVAFGNEAVNALTPFGAGVRHHCGEILERPTGSLGYVDSYVGVMVSPATAARSRQGLANFEYGTQMIKEFLEARRNHD